MRCLKELASVFSETFVLMGKLKRLSENGDLKKKNAVPLAGRESGTFQIFRDAGLEPFT